MDHGGQIAPYEGDDYAGTWVALVGATVLSGADGGGEQSCPAYVLDLSWFAAGSGDGWLFDAEGPHRPFSVARCRSPEIPTCNHFVVGLHYTQVDLSTLPPSVQRKIGEITVLSYEGELLNVGAG